MHDSRYWIWLSLAFQPGNTGFDKLFRAFGYKHIEITWNEGKEGNTGKTQQ